MGTHLKAYGSGRVALGSIDERLENWDSLRTVRVDAINPDNQPLLPIIEDKVLLRILQHCDGRTVTKMEATCTRLRRLVRKHNDELPKVRKDQIKLYFDEGEVIIVPLDERMIPTRYAMPSIEHLINCFRRLSTSSLFIRGLIPAETIPVLRRLSRYHLGASQIYFLWCVFDENAGEHLKNLFTSNLSTLSDVGFEICSPASLISDDLIENNLPQLTSLRVWHESAGHAYAISDATLFRFADLFLSGECEVETLDLSSVRITTSGVSALIEAWFRQPKVRSHIIISLYRCGITRQHLAASCQTLGIPLSSKGILETRGHRLTLHIA
ncbi:hypothetical protein M3Y99_00407500 [Aphelenchoides fujianensis]|nr:hypothetical protein M3Y99_00407500 [Aphelenchoides fujianensis]